MTEKLQLSMVLSQEFDYTYMNYPVDKDTILYRRDGRMRQYYGKLMLASFLSVTPYLDSWFVKLCPKGQRRLVVAHNKCTKTSNKFGDPKSQFYSAFPGGNEHAENKNVFTVLDCLYVIHLKIYFVLDVLAWNSVPFRQAAVQSRYHWLEARFNAPGSYDYGTTNEQHNHAFYCLKLSEATYLQQLLNQQYYIHEIKSVLALDGIIFYRRGSLYKMCFSNPDVGWLKPFMVPFYLGLTIMQCFTDSRYISMMDYLIKTGESRQIHHQHHQRNQIGAKYMSQRPQPV